MTQREFSQFVTQYEKLVFTICYQFVKDYHEAQNLSQETFLSAYRHIDSYQGDNYKPWIARIATNKAKDYLNSAYSRRVMLASSEEDSVEDMASMRAADFSEQPDEAYIQKEGSNANRANDPLPQGAVPGGVHPAFSGRKGHAGDRADSRPAQENGRDAALPRKSDLTKTD